MSDLAAALIGSWHLQSWQLGFSDSDRVRAAFGDNPCGLLVYTADGWMSAAICSRERALFPEVRSHRELPKEDLAEAFHSYFHYAGPYRVEGDVVIHSVTMSLNPNFPGTEQRRQIDLQGDTLVLTGEEPQAGRTRLHTLTWKREAG